MNKLKAVEFMSKTIVFAPLAYMILYSIVGLVNSLCELI